MNKVFAQYSAKVSELRSNMKEILSTAKVSPIAVTNHSETECYLVPANMFEEMVESFESNHQASGANQLGSFKPNSIRMKEISDACAAALQNATNDQLTEFVEY
jgi:PHD/YefM family antitoxin component YafN of YafNO toxin-antitoxin module